MAHDPKAEKAAGIRQNQRQRYGTVPDQPTKATPRTPASTDRATVGVNGGPGLGTQSGVGKGMKGKG